MRKRIHREYLGPDHGYWYTVRRSLYKGRTRFQNAEIVESETFGRVMLLDGITQLYETKEFQYHEPLVHPALCAHPKPRSVLIIGAGDGGVLREVARYKNVEHIDMVELDGGVIELAREHLPEVHAGAFDDPRVQVHIADGRAFVEGRRGEYDAVLMDMTDPQGPSVLLYTLEFFRAVRRALRDDRGVFAMHAESPDDRPAAFASILRTNRKVFRHVSPLFQFVQQYGTNWCFLHSSAATNVAALKPAVVDRRLRSAKVRGLQVYNGEAHRSMAASRPYIDALRKHPDARVIRDAAPEFPDAFENVG